MFTTECNFSKITAFKLETLQKTNFINFIVVIFMWMNLLKNFRTAISQDTSPRLLLLVKNTSRVFYWHVLSENFLIFIFIILFLFLYSFPFFTLSFSLQIIFYYFDLYLKFLIFKWNDGDKSRLVQHSRSTPLRYEYQSKLISLRKFSTTIFHNHFYVTGLFLYTLWKYQKTKGFLMFSEVQKKTSSMKRVNAICTNSVDTWSRFNVYNTWRLIDVETTTYVYWDLFYIHFCR